MAIPINKCDVSSTPSVPEPVIGNYFVSTFPPFSCWTDDAMDQIHDTLSKPVADPDRSPLGLYVHIPFCSQRCDFCYYRSYASTSRQTMEHYVSDLLSELAMIDSLPVARGRTPDFVYFGGGTPSLLPLPQLERLVAGINEFFPWDSAEEISFECAPKTATADKLAFLRKAGVTRISMGIQQLNDEILKANGRIHSSADAQRAYEAIRHESFPVVNVDLIVGLVNETDESFFDSLEAVIELEPDSITIYQLEIPPNTPLFKSQTDGSNSETVPDWDTKRRRLREAFDRLEQIGYHIRSAYAAVRDVDQHCFVYQKAQYLGADLIGTGVSSFSYVQGVHYQNLASLRTYKARIAEGELPLFRGYVLTDDERLVRQFILQLKLGEVSVQCFDDEFNINICQRFKDPLNKLSADGMLTIEVDSVRLTRRGLLRVDRILSEFFPEKYQNQAYW